MTQTLSKDEALAKKAIDLAQKTTPRKEAPTGSTLEERIARASIDVGSFLPDRNNDQGNYSYVSADQIARRGGDALAREGVVIFPAITHYDVEIRETPKGTSRFCVAKVDLRMIVSCGPEEGISRMSFAWASVGVDYTSPDKAIAKAITTGVKYFTMKLLQIGVGNEDGEHEITVEARDPEEPKPRQKPTTPEQPTTPPDSVDLLDAIVKTLKTQSDFYEACKRNFAISKQGVIDALGGLEPAAWQKAEKGRSLRSALQIVLDYSIARDDAAKAE